MSNRPLEQNSTVIEYKGVAAEDLPESSIYLEVLVPELTPAMQGAVGHALAPTTLTTTNRNGIGETGHATAATSLRCKWAGESNRSYPPRVRKGESVVVSRYANSDEYRWHSAGRDQNLRTTENHRIAIGATAERAQSKTNDNSYFIELDSEGPQHIHIHMAANNGEVTPLDIRLDGKNGIIVIQDGTGNKYYSSAKDKQVQISNSSGSGLQLIDKNAILFGVEDVIVKAGRQFVMQSPVTTIENSGGSGVAVLKAQGVSVETDAFTVKAGTIGLEGSTKVAGPLVAGPMRAEGYGTGAAGAAYPQSSTDVGAGAGTAEKPGPDNAETSGQRHAAAYEQVSQALILIRQCLDEINGKIGVPSAQSALDALAEACKMPKNLGE